jgi:hypothetical protein
MARARTSVIAYADDVTILVTSPSDIQKIQDALHCYEQATGAKVKIGKSRAVAYRILGYVAQDYGHPIPQ